ncbi:MAG TPA: helix-turn-helix domain-containing protein, partial [Lysobacter sp.]
TERIALFLHGISERYGHIGRSSTSLHLPMSRQDIAKFLGLAVETVSRGFARLQDDGVIVTTGRQVEIPDPERLRRLAHGASDTLRVASSR